MGGAIVEGLLKCGRFSNDDITVADPSTRVTDKFAKAGVSVTADNVLAAESADVVFVVVKPWLVQGVIENISTAIASTQKILVVVAARTSSENIRQWAGPGCPPFFLAIPNIAIAQLQSMTFLVPCVAKASQQTEQVAALFEAMGKVIITDEKHLAAGTTLASCGIAYAMRYIRAAAEGGVELGFRADDAKDIVMQTMKGAVMLLEESGMHPEQAIDLVATPGGVTIKGLNEMEHAGFTSAVIRGLKAGAK